jgi:hypothetical protein
MKRMILISALIVSMFFIFSMSSYADGWTDGWQVQSCGTNADLGPYIILYDGVTQIVAWPSLVEGYGKEALAVALSAQATDTLVVVGSYDLEGRFGLIQFKTP